MFLNLTLIKLGLQQGLATRDPLPFFVTMCQSVQYSGTTKHALLVLVLTFSRLRSTCNFGFRGSAALNAEKQAYPTFQQALQLPSSG